MSAPDGGSLRHSAVRGVKWTTLSTAVVTVVGLVQLAILTRLLTKTDFGLMAMIATAVGFAQVYADVGFSNAIIFRQDATPRQLSSLYWMNIIVSVSLGALVALAAPLIAAFFKEPSLVTPLRAVCLSFVILPLGQQFQVLLQRDLEFDLLARRDIAASLAGLAMAVGMAAAGQGVYALVWGQLTTITVKSVTTATVGWRRWRPSLHLRWGDLHGFLSFGLYQVGERSIYYWAANIDYLLIGRYLGPEQLGVYTVAYNLVVIPVSKLNPVLSKVAFPVFAKRQTDAEALRRGFGELVELVAARHLPAPGRPRGDRVDRRPGPLRPRMAAGGRPRADHGGDGDPQVPQQPARVGAAGQGEGRRRLLAERRRDRGHDPRTLGGRGARHRSGRVGAHCAESPLLLRGVAPHQAHRGDGRRPLLATAGEAVGGDGLHGARGGAGDAAVRGESSRTLRNSSSSSRSAWPSTC